MFSEKPINETMLVAKEKDVSFDDIKLIISSKLEKKAKITKMEVSNGFGGVRLKLDLDAGFLGGKIKAECLILNSEKDISVEILEIEARGYVKAKIEESLSGFSSEIKKYFEEKEGSPVSSVQISNAGLKVFFEDGLKKEPEENKIGESPVTPEPKEGVVVDGKKEKEQTPNDQKLEEQEEEPPVVIDESEDVKKEPEENKPVVRKKRKIAIIENKGALEEQARDAAEERLTVSKDQLKGFGGFFAKIWKHNLFLEYYRQREILIVKKEILKSGNLYVGENGDAGVHKQAMDSVLDRFVQDYEEMIHTEAGEKKRIIEGKNLEDIRLGDEINTLIKDYANGLIDDDCFNEEKNRIISNAIGFDDEKTKEKVNHTDNLFEVAKQIKIAVEHGAGLNEIDQEIEIIIGSAKIGVRTESNYNTVDRIAEKIKNSKAGRFVNETTVSCGVALAYSMTVGFSQRLARSKALAWGTLGASVLVGGTIAGVRESLKTKEERRQHSRERAKGKVFTPGMKRREEMEKTIYETVSSRSLLESIERSSLNVKNTDDFFVALNMLAEVESRIMLSDTKKIDLISYSDFKTIEKERFDLDIARAEAKVNLRNMVEDGSISLPDDKKMEHFLDLMITAKNNEIQNGVGGTDEKDEVFEKMKNKRIAKSIFKAVVTGLSVGVVAQEIGSFFNDSKEGLIEDVVGLNKNNKIESVTVLEGLRNWIEGNGGVSVRPLGQFILLDGSKVSLPEGVEIIPNPNIVGDFIFTKDGEVFSENINFIGGKLSQSSEDILNQHGVSVAFGVNHINQTIQTNTGSKEFIEKNEGLFSKIHRKFWYDNNTKRFDKNELKLHWGGKNGTGIDSNGNYVFDSSKMTSGGSYYKHLSVDAKQAIKLGKLKMLLSLDRESQFNVVEIPVDVNGKAIIDPNSEIGKTFFKNEDGQLRFIGKFAEVGYSLGLAKDGVEQFSVLATEVGPGVENLTTSTDVSVDEVLNNFGVKDDLPYIEPPVFVPIFGRTPMERMKNPKGEINYAYNGFSDIKRSDYEYRMSESLKINPDATLNEMDEIEKYLLRQDKKHLENVRELVDQIKKMEDECKISICIPVAGHQEEKNIYKTLENYLNQTAEKKEFEIVLFVNQPDVDEKGNKVVPDGTLSEINKFTKDHPEIKLRVINKTIPLNEAKIGYIRKLLNDVVVQRVLSRKKTDIRHSIVSNDADNKGLSFDYVKNFIDKFKNNPETDAYMGQLDWEIESYNRNPLVHVGTRLFQYVDIQLRKNNQNNISSSGANFAFRSEMYAAVNGYSSEIGLAEDVDLGRAIKAARVGSKNKRAVDFAGAMVSRLFTSSRRAEKAIKDGLSPIEQWNKGFGAFDDEVRKIDWEKISAGFDYDNKESVEILVDRLEYIINRTMKASTWVHGDQVVFKRALGWLGVKYKTVGVNQIKIVDASKLIKGLKQYKEDSSKILNKKTKK